MPTMISVRLCNCWHGTLCVPQYNVNEIAEETSILFLTLLPVRVGQIQILVRIESPLSNGFTPLRIISNILETEFLLLCLFPMTVSCKQNFNCHIYLLALPSVSFFEMFLSEVYKADICKQSERLSVAALGYIQIRLQLMLIAAQSNVHIMVSSLVWTFFICIYTKVITYVYAYCS